MAVPLALSQDSEVLRAMAGAFIGKLAGGAMSDDELERRGSWLLRMIVSLLALPAADADEERRLVASFLVPVLTEPGQLEGNPHDTSA